MKSIIRTVSAWALVLSAMPFFLTAAAAHDRVIVNPYAAKRFATMPDNAPYPEGIAVNPRNRNVIVGTFNFAANNRLVRFSKSGRVLANVDIGPVPILGLAYNPHDGKVYICRPVRIAMNSPSLIQRIDADFVDASSLTTVAEVPAVGAPADRVVPNPDTSVDVIQFGNFASAPNAIVFGDDGDAYFTDSFQGAAFHIADPAGNCPVGPCALVPDTVAHSPLLATAGFPPFGANGVALNDDETALFVANTGDDRILIVDLAGPGPGNVDGDTKNVDVFVESINGADGVANDGHGHLWVAANQADQLVALDMETGRVLAELGEFLGIRKDLSPRGLLFPASFDFFGHNQAVITNLALPLTGSAAEPEGDVMTFTISRINLPNL